VHGKINILHPKATAFHEPQPTTIEHAGHEPLDAGKDIQYTSYLFSCHDKRYAARFFGANSLDGFTNIDMEHITVEKTKWH
jgi:hypothetical protein